MKEIRTEILIGAEPARVWAILTRLDRYHEWNPFIPMASGDVREGARLEVRIEPPGGMGMTFTPTVTTITPEREFRWLGHFWIPRLFDGEHIFEVAATRDGRTRFVQREQFRGILVPLLWRSVDTRSRRGFEAMNEALKRKAEAAAAS